MRAPSQDERSGAGADNTEPPGSDLAATVGMMLRDAVWSFDELQARTSHIEAWLISRRLAELKSSS